MEHFDNDRLEDFFHGAFDNFESEPQPESWERIRERIKPEQKRRPIFAILVWSAALLSVGAILWQYQRADRSKDTVLNIRPEQSESTQMANSKNSNNYQKIVTTNKITNQNTDITAENNANNNINNSIDSNMKNDVNKSVSKETNNTLLLQKRRNTSKEIDSNTTIGKATIATMTSPSQKTSVTTAVEMEVLSAQSEKNTLNESNKSEIVANTDANSFLSPSIVQRGGVQKLDFLPMATTDVSPMDCHELLLPKHTNDYNFVYPKTITPIRPPECRLLAQIGLSNNFRHISPNANDSYVMKDVQVPQLVALDRLGANVNIGFNVMFTPQLGVRSTLNYQIYRSAMNYTLVNTRAESISGNSTNNKEFVVTDVKFPTQTINERVWNHNMQWQNDFIYAFGKSNSLQAGYGFGKNLELKSRTQYVYLSYARAIKRLHVEPFVQYHLKTYQDSPYYRAQPYSVGVRFGLFK